MALPPADSPRSTSVSAVASNRQGGVLTQEGGTVACPCVGRLGSARLINAINLLQRNTVDVAKAEHPHAGETGTLSHSASCPLRFPHTCPQNLFTRLSTGGATIFTLRQLDSRTTRTGVATRGTAQSRTLRAGKWYIQLSLRGRLCRGSADTRQHFGKN